MAYSPLGHGSSELLDLPEVKSVAEEVKKTPGQVQTSKNPSHASDENDLTGQFLALLSELTKCFRWCQMRK